MKPSALMRSEFAAFVAFASAVAAFVFVDIVPVASEIVEIGATRELLENPQHPYTKALLAEVPTLNTTLSEEHALKGELPSPLNPPSGCRFHTRCPVATASCRSERPALEHWKGDHQVRCPIVTA